MRRIFEAATVISLMVLATFAGEGVWAQTPRDGLHDLFEEEWASRFERDPLLATWFGIDGYGHLLPDVSPAAQARRLESDKDFIKRLKEIDRNALTAQDRTSYDVFAFVMESRIDYAAFRPWRAPFLADDGFHMELAGLVEATPVDTVADFEAYLQRLSAIGRYVDQQIANMRLGLVEGYSQPQAILANIAPSFAALADVSAPEHSVFYAPFKGMPLAFSQVDKDRLSGEARRVISFVVLPAFQKLHTFFIEEYMPAARTSLGATALPNGDALYDQRVKYFTTTNTTAQAVHALGQKEVARIRAAMQAIIEEVGFEGSFANFLEFLRTDPQFYAQTPRDLLKEAAWISKRIDEKLPAFFGKLPRMPYGVRAVPEDIAPNYTTGRYWDSIQGKRGGLFMVNTYALDKRPLYSLPALALHEGVPGHHLQNALAKEIEGVPRFRQELYISAFGEGWGLYAEKLGEDMEIYETPYERFGRLSYEMWRAGRLLVDTGLHAMGWTRQEAVDFFVENSALSIHNINTEVDRYIAWPGQALAYKMGELKILELRARAETALGAQFDIRAFHDAVLANGTLPLSLLEAEIDAFIARNRD